MPALTQDCAMTTNGNDAISADPDFVAEPVLRPRQQVEKQLRDAILMGRLQQGHRLPNESKLAEQLSVSRATVREALRALAESGLITKLPGASGGSFVKYVDHHSLSGLIAERLTSTLELGSIGRAEVTAYRGLLEPAIAGLAAQHRSDEQLAVLQETVAEPPERDAPDAVHAERDAEFRSALAEATGNRLLSATLSATYRAAPPLRDVELGARRVKRLADERVAVATAVAARNARAATAAMQRYLRAAPERPSAGASRR